MKGIQEALGMESANHMKGLQVFIADIRSCQTKDQEQKRVEKEMAKIRLKFTTTKAVSGYDKKKYVWKLLYAYMLGYDIDFGHFQAVELCSSNKFSEKNAGYLAISLLLADNNDILRLVVNSVKNDISSPNEHNAALALNTVANIAGAEFADNLFADISKMLLSHSGQYSAYLKRKACICLLRLYRKDNDTLQPEVWRKKIAALFHERDIGLLTSVSGFALAILEMGTFPIQEWIEILPAVVSCLHRIVQGDCPDHYEYYHVPAPWLQMKLLRILQFFPPRTFAEELGKVNSLLHNILTRPAVQRTPPPPGGNAKKRCKADAERQNRSNAEHGILFEAMNLMIHLEDRCDPETTRTASGLLGAFIGSTDANIRYLGLETMARLATNGDTLEHLERYRTMILEKMHEPDISIRRQALNLLYALCRPENWQQIVDELLEIVGTSDQLLQEELVLKIAILAEKNAPNFRWYVDVVFRMLESAPDAVGDDVWYRVVQVVTGFEEGQNDQEKTALQRHAAGNAFKNLSQQFPHETMVKLGAYLIGEFGHNLPNSVHPRAKFEALAKHYNQVSSTAKAILLLAMVKLLNANPQELRQDIMNFLEDLSDQQDVELQQRACELMNLTKDEDLFENVLAVMPVYAEAVQMNNPLIARLKFQHKSRAHTRTQLEQAAKSEGGMYKPGQGGKGAGKGGDSPSRGNNNMPALGDMTSPNSRGNYANNQRTQGDSESEESGSEESDDEDGASAAKEMWKQLCIMPQGPFFASDILRLELRQEYNQAQGRMQILWQCKEPLSNIRVNIPELPHVRVKQDNQAPANLRPGQQEVHTLQVQCLRPFLQPLSYLVEYGDSRGKASRLPLMLPCVLTKFIAPAEMPLGLFRQHFEGFGGQGQEASSVSTAKVPPNQWPNYLTKGFNLFMLQESNPTTSFAAGTFNTGTPDPSNPGKMMSVPCMVRLDFQAERKMIKITVRTQHAEVSQPLLKILETYLCEPR